MKQLYIILALLITPLFSQNEVKPDTVNAEKRWNNLSFLDASSGDALCIPIALIMMNFIEKYKGVLFKNLPIDVQEYLTLAELFSVTRVNDSLGVPVWKTYSSEYQKLEHDDPVKLSKLRKQFNVCTLKFWKLLTMKDLPNIANTAFPYKDDLLSLPNTSALYALFKYASEYHIPVGIHWRSVKIAANGLKQELHCTKFYLCQDNGVLIPLNKTPNHPCAFIRFIVVLDGKNEALLNAVFQKTKIADVINGSLNCENLYQLAAVADLSDFKDQVKEDVVAFVCSNLPFMKQIYGKAAKLTNMMDGDDSYTIDNKTKYKMSQIIRLDHAYIS